MFGHNCEVQIMMHKEKPKQELWKFVVSGYLRAMNEKDSPASFEGFDHNFTVSKTQINYSQNYSIKEDIPLFALLFKPDILISAAYYIKAPTHLNSVKLFLSVYRWSHSWVNVVVNWAGMFAKSLAITSLPGKHSLDKRLQKIVKRPEPVLVLHMFPNETVKASILAVSGKDRLYLWSDEYVFTESETGSVVVVALSGNMDYAAISSNGSFPSLVEYQWVYPQFSKTPKGIKSQLCGGNLDLLSSTRIFSVIKQIGSRYYHFKKTFALPCEWSRFFYAFHCAAEPLSWIQAAKKCNAIGGSLPEFLSREELEEVQYLLKVSRDLYSIEALCIGLVTSNTSRYLAVADPGLPSRGHQPQRGL